MDSPDFSISRTKRISAKTLRQICAEIVPQLESAGFEYAFDIPEDSIYVMLDAGHFGRIIQNLTDNAVSYNRRERRFQSD
jgi:signal transduction histidine kinase